MSALWRAAAWLVHREERAEDGVLCPPEMVTQQRQLEQEHPSTSRYEGPRTPSPEEELVLHTSPLPVQLANDPDCRAAQGTRTGCPCPSWGWHSHEQGLPWSLESRVSAGGAGSPPSNHAGGWQATAAGLAGCQGRRVQSSGTAPPFHTMIRLTAWLPTWRKWPRGNNMLRASTLQWGPGDRAGHPHPPPALLSNTQWGHRVTAMAHHRDHSASGQRQSHSGGCRGCSPIPVPHPSQCPRVCVAPEASRPQGWLFGWLLAQWRCTHQAPRQEEHPGQGDIHPTH